MYYFFDVYAIRDNSTIDVQKANANWNSDAETGT